MIEDLRTKQSPVEDLLSQADNLIVNQKPNCRPEVYSAMAESLGKAWRQVNAHLERRRTILDRNYVFQGHFHVGLENKLQIARPSSPTLVCGRSTE